jgi:hypothetical protein
VRLVDDSNVKIDMDIHIGAEFPGFLFHMSIFLVSLTWMMDVIVVIIYHVL